MRCTHPGYYKLAVNCDGVDLPAGGTVPAAANTVAEVFNALATIKSFSAHHRLSGKIVTFEVTAGCSDCGIAPERKLAKVLGGQIVIDLPPQAA